MGHWGVWGCVLAGVRVIEEGGVIGMGYWELTVLSAGSVSELNQTN